MTNRKLVYSAVLEPHCESDSNGQGIGVGHPLALTIAQREQVVRNGLGDREEVGRSAAGSLVGAWANIVGDGHSANAKEKEKGKEKERDKAAVEHEVVALLKLFDLAESRVAEEMLLSVFKGRVDIFDVLEFSGQCWH
jgi:condensin complex subunit 3